MIQKWGAKTAAAAKMAVNPPSAIYGEGAPREKANMERRNDSMRRNPADFPPPEEAGGPDDSAADSPSGPVSAPPPDCVLGLDFGSRRIGVAVSDPEGRTARPVLTLERKNMRQDLRSLLRLARKYGCREAVVGEPLYPSGDASPQAERARQFAQALEREGGIPVHLWDERLSTAEAHRYLDAAGRPGSARRDVIDQIAATLILQTFLDARKARKARNTAV